MCARAVTAILALALKHAPFSMKLCRDTLHYVSAPAGAELLHSSSPCYDECRTLLCHGLECVMHTAASECLELQDARKAALDL